MTKDTKTEDAVTSATNMMKAWQEAAAGSMPGSMANLGANLGPMWLQTMTSLGTEMLNFVAERVKTDVQTQQELLKAKGLAEVQQIQARFIEKAMQDYRNEMARMMQLTQDKAATSPDTAKRGD